MSYYTDQATWAVRHVHVNDRCCRIHTTDSDSLVPQYASVFITGSGPVRELQMHHGPWDRVIRLFFLPKAQFRSRRLHGSPPFTGMTRNSAEGLSPRGDQFGKISGKPTTGDCKVRHFFQSREVVEHASGLELHGAQLIHALVSRVALLAHFLFSRHKN